LLTVSSFFSIWRCFLSGGKSFGGGGTVVGKVKVVGVEVELAAGG